jgi:hypothetical protein
MTNRNIITKDDVPQIEELLKKGVIKAEVNVQLSADDFLNRLMKYVPVEIIGVYTVIEVNLKSLVNPQNERSWLMGLFIFGLVATFFYVKFYLKVVRYTQIFMTVLAFAVWVFSIGGWFTTLDFWKAGWGIIASVIYLFVVKIMRLDPLP